MSYQIKFVNGELFQSALGKVVCVGRNYAEHAKELNNPIPTEPILFIKPESSVVVMDNSFTILESDCHYETEIAVLIGKTLCKASEQQAAESVVGLGLALDLTKRSLQSKLKEKGHPWEKAKSFDGACPLTSFVPRSEFSDLGALSFTLDINGERRQNGNSADMLTPIIPLLVHISQHFTLKSGDIVLTGTPKGVGQLSKGDKLDLNLMDKLVLETIAI